MSVPRRLLMTADAVGGVWTYALDLADGLARRGVETTLAILGPSPAPDQTREAGNVPGLVLVDTGLPLDWTADGPGALTEANAVLREVAFAARAEIVHLNSPALAAGGRFEAPVLGACHSCLATWWAAVKPGDMPADFRWRTQALWRGLLACDALLAPSHAFARDLARTYECAPPLVVYNGRPRRVRRAHHGDEPFIFTAGRLWDEGKNIQTLGAAAARIGARVYAAGPVVGPTPGPPARMGAARPLGRLSAEEMQGWIGSAAIYASSALYEPFGLSVLEAAQADCALVLSEIPTFRELWEDAAVFVDPRSADDYAAAFERLLADPRETSRLAARAKARAARFTIERMSTGVLGVYRDLRAAYGRRGLREAAA